MKPEKTLPFLCTKDWGGEKLSERFHKSIPSPATGESWEISAHPGGECRVFGMPLFQAVERFGAALMGEIQGSFPLLIKFLDARENLSVQVHPDDALARELEGQPFGKTEAWVILEPPEDGELILGAGGTPEELRRAVERERVESVLGRIVVQPLDTIYIPAGTIHALTAGALVYEVQQSSDTTYRLYAWGRDAQLHIEPALRCAALQPEGAGLVFPREVRPRVGRLADCAAFTLDRLDARESEVASDTREGFSRFHCLTALGEGELSFDGGRLHYAAGESILIPACTGAYRARGAQLLRAVPGRG